MPRWTPESRAKQAEVIRQWAPWKKSTGPRTASGKHFSAMRGNKGLTMLRKIQAGRIAKIIKNMK